MNFRRVHTQKRNKGGLWIALIFLFISIAKAQSNYPITDPRNPNCPCHKYQKLAEEEYKQMLAQTNKQTNEPLLASNKKNGISDDGQGKINKIPEPIHVQILNDDKILEGVSSDKLIRINVSEGDNVMGKINEEPGELILSEQKMTRSGSSYRAPHYYTTKHWKGKHKKHTAFHKQLKRIFYVSGWDIWKRKRITSACYQWR